MNTEQFSRNLRRLRTGKGLTIEGKFPAQRADTCRKRMA